MTEFGFSDVPADEDLVSVDKYLTGLAEFIEECPTPMTIAIQGDWGTGKTSAMSTLKRKLGDDYWKIDFNTWQYSQFDLGDQLVFSLIGTILTEIDRRLPSVRDEEKATEARKNLRRLQRGLAVFSRQAVKILGNTFYAGVGDALDASVEAATKKDEDQASAEEVPGPEASVALITTLREDLSRVVGEVCAPPSAEGGSLGPRRIVAFIDDLDRLEPERAVAVMEAIKVFLDIPDCVFVLAIDFAVVLRGVRAKYGEDFGEEKARAFFDKIIQVPFNLPTGAYAISELVGRGLQSVRVETPAGGTARFEELVLNSAGTNPRSIKRLFNTYGLIKKIGLDSDSSPSGAGAKARDIDIFAILCLQTAYPRVFAALVRSFEGNRLAETWKQMLDVSGEGDFEDAEELLKQWGIGGYRTESFAAFMRQLSGIFGSPTRGGELDEALFKDALVKAAVTAAGTADVEGMRTSGAFRGSELVPFEDRVAGVRARWPHWLRTASIASAFEEGLQSVVGPVDAGVAKNGNWSYQAGSDGPLPENIRGKRFVELHMKKYGVGMMFGNFMTPEQRDEAVERFHAELSEVDATIPGHNPPVSVNQIKTEEQARLAAKIIGEAYMGTA